MTTCDLVIVDDQSHCLQRFNERFELLNTLQQVLWFPDYPAAMRVVGEDTEMTTGPTIAELSIQNPAQSDCPASIENGSNGAPLSKSSAHPDMFPLLAMINDTHRAAMKSDQHDRQIFWNPNLKHGVIKLSMRNGIECFRKVQAAHESTR